MMMKKEIQRLLQNSPGIKGFTIYDVIQSIENGQKQPSGDRKYFTLDE